MANIVNPVAVKFSNEQVRPLAERARALKAAVTSMSNDWFGGINAMFPNDSSPLVDGRTAEGINPLTGADVNSVVGELISLAAAINDQIMGKPCVRPLEV